MKCYVFDDVKKLTTNWHDEGGAVAVAATLDRARELINARALGGGILTAEPDAEYDVSDEVPELAWVFPNAGCC